MMSVVFGGKEMVFEIILRTAAWRRAREISERMVEVRREE